MLSKQDLIPEERNFEIKTNQTEIDSLLLQANKLTVCSKWSAEAAMDLVVDVRKAMNKVDSVKKTWVDPHREAINQINGLFNGFLESLKAIEETLKEKIISWKQARKHQQEIEFSLSYAAFEDEETKVVPFLQEDTELLRSKLASTYEISQWNFIVEDLSKVPIDFLRLDEEKLKSSAKMGVRHIPGVKIEENKKLIIRTR